MNEKSERTMNEHEHERNGSASGAVVGKAMMASVCAVRVAWRQFNLSLGSFFDSFRSSMVDIF